MRRILATVKRVGLRPFTKILAEGVGDEDIPVACHGFMLYMYLLNRGDCIEVDCIFNQPHWHPCCRQE